MKGRAIILGTDSGTFWTGVGAEPWTDDPAEAATFAEPREAWQAALYLLGTQAEYLDDSAVELHLFSEDDPEKSALATTTDHRSNRPALRRRWRQHFQEPLPPDLPSSPNDEAILSARVSEYLEDLDAVLSSADEVGALRILGGADKGALSLMRAAVERDAEHFRTLMQEHLNERSATAVSTLLGAPPEPVYRQLSTQQLEDVRDENAGYASVASRTSAGAQQQVRPTGAGEGGDAGSEPLPAFVRRHFVQVDGRFYHRHQPDRLAFARKGDSFRARDDSESVATALAEIAAARGWGAIKVSGSKVFRRHVWLAASKRGLEVTGYAPTDAERALSSGTTNAATQRFPMPPRRNNRATPTRIDGNAREPSVGRLLDHGPAPYQHDDALSPSYFVSIASEDGRVATHWGLDLERALKEARAAVGDRIRLTRNPAAMGVGNVDRGDADQAMQRVGRARWSVALEGEGRAASWTPDGQRFDRRVTEDAASRVVERFASTRFASITSADRTRLQDLVADARGRLIGQDGAVSPTRMRETVSLRHAERER